MGLGQVVVGMTGKFKWDAVKHHLFCPAAAPVLSQGERAFPGQVRPLPALPSSQPVELHPSESIDISKNLSGSALGNRSGVFRNTFQVALI